jgi:ABC-type nitrate/sulfonate/bicarbonate transport system substrate-binding protein
MTNPGYPAAFSRRRFLAGSAAAAGAAGLGTLLNACGASSQTTSSSSARSPTSVRLSLGWIKNVEFAGLWLADANGYFTKQGIQPVIGAGGPTAPDPTVLVASGAADIGDEGAGLAVLMQAIAKGNDFVIIGTTFQQSPGCVISLPSHPITEPKDLVGCTFLGQQGVQDLINASLTLAGLPHRYTFVPVGFSVEPLLQHQGNAYSGLVTNQVVTMELQGMTEGKDFIVATWAQLGLPSYLDIFFTTRNYLKAHRDTVVAFMKATAMGWQQNETVAPSVAAHLAVTNYGAGLGLNLAQQTLENKLQIPFTKSAQTAAHGLLWVDPDTLGSTMYPPLKAFGLSGLPSPASIVDTTILADVYDGKTTLNI